MSVAALAAPVTSVTDLRAVARTVITLIVAAATIIPIGSVTPLRRAAASVTTDDPRRRRRRRRGPPNSTPTPSGPS